MKRMVTFCLDDKSIEVTLADEKGSLTIIPRTQTEALDMLVSATRLILFAATLNDTHVKGDKASAKAEAQSLIDPTRAEAERLDDPETQRKDKWK